MENNRMQRGNMAARNHRAMNKSALHVRFEISFLNSYDMTMLREKTWHCRLGNCCVHDEISHRASHRLPRPTLCYI